MTLLRQPAAAAPAIWRLDGIREPAGRLGIAAGVRFCGARRTGCATCSQAAAVTGMMHARQHEGPSAWRGVPAQQPGACRFCSVKTVYIRQSGSSSSSRSTTLHCGGGAAAYLSASGRGGAWVQTRGCWDAASTQYWSQHAMTLAQRVYMCLQGAGKMTRAIWVIRSVELAGSSRLVRVLNRLCQAAVFRGAQMHDTISDHISDPSRVGRGERFVSMRRRCARGAELNVL